MSIPRSEYSMYNAVKNSIALTFCFVIFSQWAVFYPVFVGNPLAYPDTKRRPHDPIFLLAIATFQFAPSLRSLRHPQRMKCHL